MDYQVLSAYGIDHQAGVHRCMDDRTLYERMLIAFLQDDSFARAKAAMQEKDYERLFECAHEMKGACGNVDFLDLLGAVAPLVELLRNHGYQNVSEARIAEQFALVEAAYLHTQEGVSLALGM